MSQRAGIVWAAVISLGLVLLLIGNYIPWLTWLLIPIVLVLPIYSLISGDSGYDDVDKN